MNKKAYKRMTKEYALTLGKKCNPRKRWQILALFDWKQLMKMRKFLLFLPILFFLGCKSQSQIVAVERHDSIRTDDHDHSHHQRDSIYIHDSVYIVIKGDTVHEHHYHTEYKEKAVADTIHDSINVEVHDSVPYPVEVPVYVRERNAYDKATAKGFWILLAIIVVAVVIWIGKRKNWFTRILSWIRI